MLCSAVLCYVLLSTSLIATRSAHCPDNQGNQGNILGHAEHQGNGYGLNFYGYGLNAYSHGFIVCGYGLSVMCSFAFLAM